MSLRGIFNDCINDAVDLVIPVRRRLFFLRFQFFKATSGFFV